MYGTIALLKPREGEVDNLNALFEEWWNERRPKVQGAISSTIYRNEKNPAELMVAVVFDSKENYQANAADPDRMSGIRRWRRCSRASHAGSTAISSRTNTFSRLEAGHGTAPRFD